MARDIGFGAVRLEPHSMDFVAFGGRQENALRSAKSLRPADCSELDG